MLAIQAYVEKKSQIYEFTQWIRIHFPTFWEMEINEGQ